VVLGLPRGGVVVAAEVARALGAPLDAIMVRKLGVPVQPELAMGAIGEDGIRILSEDVMRRAGVTADQLEAVEQRERAELERRAQRYRGDGPRLALGGRTAIVVDDGIATGSTAYAACRVARAHGATRVVLAVPVGSPEAVAALATVADDVRCLETPAWLGAIGQFYGNFRQVDDDEVVALLREQAPPVAGGELP
jgi:putative phosphoribosyl transferase